MKTAKTDLERSRVEGERAFEYAEFEDEIKHIESLALEAKAKRLHLSFADNHSLKLLTIGFLALLGRLFYTKRHIVGLPRPWRSSGVSEQNTVWKLGLNGSHPLPQ
jgi:hypothetical protein